MVFVLNWSNTVCQDDLNKTTYVPWDLKEFWRFRGQLTLSGKLLLYQCRIVVPTQWGKFTLKMIHDGHQGIQRCKMRVSCSVWWPEVSKEIESFVYSCPVCQKPLPPIGSLCSAHVCPCTPQWIATDLFELNGFTYLIVVDYITFVSKRYRN